ncbi:MAG TPA: DUF1289 domain-containing protein [Candidatus Krumholzibacteria bacterium]|nr:DUF1289 domain-containing protein [Candidatus Krumholzibacteria bacterium]
MQRETSQHPSSPCTSLCVLDSATGRCQGCGRTLEEIGRWSAMTAAEKWAVLRAVRARRGEQEPLDG